ncbi:ATP-dependent DNA ligase [Paenibacillus cremeus]|uniref:DNA ligase n=1 Tax=Paenibacillus cremeus TaxID=2163881 RepID=A0A559KBQ3_9BACL|nr:RNA ligase family protein [Paenibacillus cremeus]TVY09529.1 DNA ligase [Paenibacillus cremeus]
MLFNALKPMLADWGVEAFDDEDYLFEPKWDGARILLHKQGERIEAYTRSGIMVSAKFPELKEVAACIRSHTAILDCEGICLQGGQPVFDDFMYRLRLGQSLKIDHACRTHPASFIVFDVLLTHREHLDEPLLDRKRRIEELLAPSPVLAKTLSVENQGQALFALTKQQGMEGMVAKRKQSKYRLNTTSRDWLKLKHRRTIDTVILGYKLEPFQLVVGLQFRTVKNKPVGIVESGMGPKEQAWFLGYVQAWPYHQEGTKRWIEPQLCCRIQYGDRSDMHQLNRTQFVQFLPEQRAEECVWDGGKGS